MRGWERIGRIARTTRDFDLWLVEAYNVRHGDVLRFSAYEDGPLRVGSVQVKGLLANGVVTDERTDIAVPYAADYDVVFRATALGENAFKPRASTPDD